MQRTLTFLLLFICALHANAQASYHISVSIEGYEQDFLTMANNVMDKQYIVDTAYRDPSGDFVFESDSAGLPAGIYLVVTAPDNNYFQVLIDRDQEFSLQTSTDQLSKVKVEGDSENQLFYEYLDFLAVQSEQAGPLNELLADSTISEANKAEFEATREALNKEVESKQQSILDEHPNSFTAAIIRTNKTTPPPAFDGIEDEQARREASFRWLRAHYFDHIDLKDERLLRTPFLQQRLDYFVDKLTVQHPDTVSAAVDRVLERMDPSGEMFKYYVVHFTNKAAASKIVGMDAVYVHMVDNYYANGKAYWAEEEQLAKMRENADKTRPLLIGKQAPDIKMKTRAGEDVTLYGLDAEYTILYFWAFDCGHCKKSTPHMKDFYAKWRPKGVEIFSICTKQSKLDQCWEYVDDKEIGDWMHVTDKYMRFYKDYDIKSTPTIFVLDENKRIVSKRIGAEQLDELLTALEKQAAANTAGK